jgi:predicted ATPase
VAPVLVRAADGGLVVNDPTEEPRIRTPDQRLRIFVSSTLLELRPERAAARHAIEGMHLAPVMFELGARPHPPRELYRAYLAQSDVFVGIYWQEYGWIAPGEDISGLEDEYCLAPGDMPKLIYVKRSAEREPRLAALLERIRDDDGTSYMSFDTADELARLVGSDLASLLAERFDASRSEPAPSPDAGSGAALDVPAVGGRIPVTSTDAVGRETAIATLLDWLGSDAKRLVTLVGPGGIGKTRLAVEIARLAQDRFDRVTFVRLAEVAESGDVLPSIARDLGVRDTRDRPLVQQIGSARTGRVDLIVLDNFEQVLPAAMDVLALLNALPGATFLVTSRARLRVRGEHVFDVEPLALPDANAPPSVEQLLEAPAVRMFRDRAEAADPRFELTAENAAEVASICRALEGVPLALELAAARIRILTPAAMLARLDRVLPLLTTGDRDVPERQRTIRATVEWSIDLLSPDARSMFTCLGVFSGDFSLDAAEAVTAGAPWATDLLGTLLELVDGSLVRQREEAGVPFFSMLVPVRELAAARFAEGADAAAVYRAHADFYVELSLAAEPLLRGPTQPAAVARLEAERDNLRAAYRHLIALGEGDAVAEAVWQTFLYWWIRSLMPEARAWMEEVLDAHVPLSRRARAIALAYSSWVSVWQRDPSVTTEPAAESVELFRAEGDEFSEALALAILSLCCMSVSPPQLRRALEGQQEALDLPAVQANPTFLAVLLTGLGRVLFHSGDPAAALEVFERSRDVAVAAGDLFVESIAVTQVGWARLALGDPRPDPFLRALEIATGLDNVGGIAFAFEGLAATAGTTGDVERAGTLLGAAESLRSRTGLMDQREYRSYQPVVDAILAGDRAADFEAAREAGRRMARPDALAMALEPTSQVTST